MVLYELIKASILIINGLAVLDERRFLKPWGLGMPSTGEVAQAGVKQKLAQMLWAIRIILRVPLIWVNLFLIVIELVFG
ncbi:hypothetical protein AAMO2058_000025100 [Amorphochlora amoebiformis]|eukprot:411585-Amorphochlora_amoeboformis.AAC.1